MQFGTIWPRAERGLLDADDVRLRGRRSFKGKKDPRLKPGRDQDVVVATPPARNNLILMIKAD